MYRIMEFEKIWSDFKGHLAHHFTESQYFCYQVDMHFLFRHNSSIGRKLSPVSLVVHLTGVRSLSIDTYSHTHTHTQICVCVCVYNHALREQKEKFPTLCHMATVYIVLFSRHNQPKFFNSSVSASSLAFNCLLWFLISTIILLLLKNGIHKMSPRFHMCHNQHLKIRNLS